MKTVIVLILMLSTFLGKSQSQNPYHGRNVINYSVGEPELGYKIKFRTITSNFVYDTIRCPILKHYELSKEFNGGRLINIITGDSTILKSVKLKELNRDEKFILDGENFDFEFNTNKSYIVEETSDSITFACNKDGNVQYFKIIRGTE